MEFIHQARSENSRRKLLKALGAGALLTTVMPFKLKATALSKANVGNVKVFATVSQMQKDKDLNADDLARVLGYFEVNDGGAAEYLIAKPLTYDLKEEQVVDLGNNLSAVLIPGDSVNYKIFGAIGDAKNNDALQIQKTHNYANLKQIPVINFSGEFWMKELKTVVILTDVNWGNTVFHIDEQFNTKSSNRFEIRPSQPSFDIKLNATDKAQLLAQLKPSVQNIPILAPYKNCLVFISDKDDGMGNRSGAKYKGQTRAKEEFFYIEENGRIIGDIAWTFNNYTSLKAYPVDKNYRTVEGGTFLISGNSPGEAYTGYKKNGFSVSRSRIIIKNQWVGLEPGKLDDTADPRSGFYTFSNLYDVTLENVRLIPYIYDKDGTENDLKAGTYGISAGRMLNSLFKNVTAEGGLMHWGVFGTNLNKNFRIENCKLNRIDVHFHCWNLYIRDSTIGARGISVTGGGDLLIENTSCSSRNFINFRRDYGAKWDGDIRLVNCKFLPAEKEENYILDFNPSNFNYGYPLGFGRSIVINGLTVDFNAYADNDAVCWLIKTPTFGKTKDESRLFFPTYVNIANVRVKGRDKGLRLMKVVDPQHLLLNKLGSYDEVDIENNTELVFSDIDLEDLNTAEPEACHFSLISNDAEAYSASSLYPKVSFQRCKNLQIETKRTIADFVFDDCRIAGFTSNRGMHKGRIVLNNCKIYPVITNEKEAVLKLDTTLGTHFTNCIVHLPKFKGAIRPDLLEAIGFMSINSILKFNHLNTTLGKDVLISLQKKGVVVLPKYVQSLKSHHELESETISR